jgi:hypothetical protein
MSNSHFLVYLRDASWQFTYRGSITAPFKSREEAIEAAIEAAQESDDPDVEVVVQDADMRTETIWRPQRG